MGLARRIIGAILCPQLLVIMLAVFACFAGLAGHGYHISIVSAASNRVPAQTDFGEESILPDTGMHLPAKPLTFSLDCSYAPCLALTFDDGPDASTTPQIVSALEKGGAKATFFVIGSRIAGHEALLQRMEADGFDIGNHSWSHPDFTKLNPEQMLEQVSKTQSAMRAAGLEPASFFRLPYGFQNDMVRQTVPLPIVLWNADPKDWHEKDPKALAGSVEAVAKPGAIIIMHDTQVTTAAAITDIINRLQQHYQLVTISQLVQIPPNARGDTVIY